MTARSRAAIAALTLLGTAALTGCDPLHSTPAAATGTPHPATSSAVTAPPTTTASSPALAKLAELRIAPEDTGAHYKRKDWKHWIGQPTFGKGCDTRDMILIQQGHHAGGGAVERDPATCEPYAGHGNSWTSVYDDVTVTDPGQLDIDHWVALEEVARSGTRGWTAAQRQAYANDPTVLLAVTAHSNRSKGSDDPAKWLPNNRCGYVEGWVAIKARYRMTVDQAEHDAIASVLRRCTSAR